MTMQQAIALGILEGLTEFLPISSTGHMIIASPLLGIDEKRPDWPVFLFVSQLGAILAVVIYYWRDLWKKTLQRPAKWSDYLWVKLIAAFIPSAIAGVLLNDVSEAYLETNPAAVAGALVLGAVVMEWIDRRYRRETGPTLDDITLRQAVWIGLAQCLSIWPGVSRAGATIFAGMVVGLPPRTAAEFSFLLAIPTILGAAAYRVLKYRDVLSGVSGTIMLVGAATAFIVALLVVAGFLRYLQRHRFTVFAAYRVVLGLLVILYYVYEAQK